MERSRHFHDMLKERHIDEDWVNRCEQSPDKTEEHNDGTLHLIKLIPEFGSRWLRVIVNTETSPHKEVTAFFDRRLRKEHENQG